MSTKLKPKRKLGRPFEKERIRMTVTVTPATIKILGARRVSEGLSWGRLIDDALATAK